MAKSRLANQHGISKKDILILKELNDNPFGLRTTTLLKLTNLKPRTLYNHLESLKKQKIVENAYPIWKIAKSLAQTDRMAKLLKSDKKVEGHKFSFILRLVNKPIWWSKRHNKLYRLKEYDFKPLSLRNNPYQQGKVDNFLVQTFSNSIVFISQKKYWSDDAYDAFLEALEDVLGLIGFLEEKFKFRFVSDGVPSLSVRSNHLVRVRDSLSKRCRSERGLFELTIDNKLRAWVDASTPVGTEFGHRDYAPGDLDRYGKVIEDYIENNASLPVDVDNRIKALVEVMGGIQANQLVFDANMKSHIEAVKQLGEAVKRLNELLEVKNGA